MISNFNPALMKFITCGQMYSGLTSFREFRNKNMAFYDVSKSVINRVVQATQEILGKTTFGIIFPT